MEERRGSNPLRICPHLVCHIVIRSHTPWAYASPIVFAPLHYDIRTDPHTGRLNRLVNAVSLSVPTLAARVRP